VIRADRNPLFITLGLAAVLLTSAACSDTSADRDGEEAHVQAMEREHANDTPQPSPAATAAPAGEVDSSEVVYATLAGDPATQVTGYLARPRPAGSQAAPAIILIHEWWGLNDNIRAVADRFAGEGYIALAVDLYEGRFADTREGAADLMRGTLDKSDRLEDNLRQARDYLIETAGASSVGSIGWCFGGGWSLNAAIALGGDLDAAVIYYGRVTDDRERLGSIEAPILGLFGGLDGGIPVDSVRAFQTALEELGGSVEIHVYDDADHAFANPTGTRYNEAAATDAWGKTLAFLGENLN